MKFKIGILVLSVIILNIATVKASEIISPEQAETIAQSQLPERSKLVELEDSNNTYNLKFYNKYKKEKYKIDIDKYTEKITTYESQQDYLDGSENINLTEQEIEKIILAKIANAKYIKISLDGKNNLQKYKANFNVDSYFGQMTINPSTGIILEIRFKLITDIDKDIRLLSFDEAKEIAFKEIPYVTVVDINLEEQNDIYIYEMKLYDDRLKYDFKINALTGEKISISIDNDNWSTTNPTLEWTYTQLDSYSIYNNCDYITLKKAKQMAIEKVPGAKLDSIELIEENAQLIYSGVMNKDGFEYKFSLDYYTGQVVKWVKEEID